MGVGFNICHYLGDWLNIPLLSRVISPTISVSSLWEVQVYFKRVKDVWHTFV